MTGLQKEKIYLILSQMVEIPWNYSPDIHSFWIIFNMAYKFFFFILFLELYEPKEANRHKSK